MHYGLPILSLENAVDRAQLATRAHLCSHCPYRSKEDDAIGVDMPRQCEADCEFFQQLPRLVRIARCVDPVVGSLSGMMNRRIREVCEILPRSAKGRRDFLLMQRPQIIRDLQKIVGR